jgi:hypothetical protein
MFTAEAVPMGIEQHLVGLQQIGSDEEGAAMGQLDMRDLQLRALTAKHRVVFAPVELEGLPGPERQGDEDTAPGGLLLALAFYTPFSGEGRDPVVGARVAKRHQIAMQLLHRSPLLAGFRSLRLQPRSKLFGIGIKLARPSRDIEPRLDRARTQIFLDGVPRQPGSARDLSDR